MKRRIWIVKRKDKLTEANFSSALLNDCSEIANGIPPTLRGILLENQLPIVYEGPDLPPSKPPRDLAAEIDELKIRVVALEIKKVE